MSKDDFKLPEFELPDYSMEKSAPSSIPENYSEKYSFEATAGTPNQLISKVRRRIIKGRIDGN